MTVDREARPSARATPFDRRRGVLADVVWMVGLAAGAAALFARRINASTAGFSFTAVDAYGYFLPAYTYQAERLAAGALPFWNPYQGGGVPFLATLQPGALYPARLLLLATSPAHAMGWSAFLHVTLALGGTFLLCRRLGTSRAAATCAAIVFATGCLLPWLRSTTLLEPAAWLPVLALGVVRVLRGAGWRWVLGLGAAGAMPLLAGGYQVSLYTAYALAAVALAVALDDRAHGSPPRLRDVGGLAVAGLLALATAAPQLATTLAWSGETMRQARALSDLQLMPLMLPAARAERIRAFFVHVSPDAVCQLSIPVVALVAIGIVWARPAGLVFGLVAVLTALFTIAPPGGLLFALYKAVPGFAMFRFPSRLLAVTSLFAGVAAALGLRALARVPALATGPRRTLLELGALATVVVLLVLPYRSLAPVPWGSDPAARAALPLPLPERPAASRVWMDGEYRARTFPRQGMRERVRVLQDYDPMSARRLGVFLAAVSGLPRPSSDAFMLFNGSLPDATPRARPDLLDLAAVDTVVTASAQIDATGWRRVGGSAPLAVYRNARALPRAFLVERARFVPDEDAALAALVSREVDPHVEAVLVGAPGDDQRALADAPPAPAVPSAFSIDEPERVAIDVAVSRPALLVLADSFAPGWSVTVDGAQRRLWQANYLVRAVHVRPGDRRVEFRYRAPGFAIGVTIALGAWALVLAGMALGRLRRA